jgi:UDP-glucose 4-epimerase
MPQVFITGIAGFLGSHIAERYGEAGYDVVGIDNLSGGVPTNVPDGAQFEVVDCLDRRSYLDLMRGSEIVYHCAAAAYDGLSVFSPAHVFRNTAQATAEVASAALTAGVGRFVQCSSMSRYGNQTAPFREDMSPQPVNPYGVAKWTADLLVSNLFTIHPGEFAIAVPHNIVGPRQRYDDPYRNVVAIMINRMTSGLQPIIYGDGQQVRCFSFIEDVLYCLERMGTEPRAAGQVINIGPDETTTTILGLVQEIASLLDFSLDPIFVPARPTEVTVATCSSDKARALLGYETKTSLREGLATMIEWFMTQPRLKFRYDIEIEINSPNLPETWSGQLI